MATPISTLINNISDSLDGLINNITNSTSQSGMPQTPDNGQISSVLSTIEPGNWMRLSFPYTFSVVDISTNESGVQGFTDFSLPINPQSIQQSEEPATSIVPTQGGTVSSHSGNKYKMLNIKGTTGIHPNKGAGGAQRSTGQAILKTDELRNKSGYEVFLRLRNWFRAYYEYKKVSGDSAKNLRLVFKNYKDGEFLIVELTKFNMDRQASKSFMYDYDLEFKVLAHLSFKSDESNFQIDTLLTSAVDLIDTARGTFLGTQDILRQIEQTYQFVILDGLRRSSLAVKAFQGIEPLAADIESRTRRNTISEASALRILLNVKEQQEQNKVTGDLDPRIANIELPSDLSAAVKNQGTAILDTFGPGLMALDSSIFPENTRLELEEEKNSIVNQPRSFYEDSLNELKRLKRNAEDFFGLGSVNYDDLFDRTATLSPSNIELTPEQYSVLDGFNNAIQGLQLLLASEDLFRSTFNEVLEDIVERFDNKIDLQTSPAVREMRVSRGVSIERIAQRELGNSERWGEIAELNGLKAPYIVDDNSENLENVLKPGDIILIPTGLVNGFSRAPIVKENKLNKNLTELERSLGTDFKLDANFDLVLDSFGDIQLVAGSDNMAQQVILKLSYEKGEVMKHPQLGAGIQVGSKFPPLQQVKDGLIDTLLRDTRIDTVEDITVIRENSELVLTFVIKIKQIDLPIPIKIKIN